MKDIRVAMYSLIGRSVSRINQRCNIRSCATAIGQTVYAKTIDDMEHPKALPLIGTKLDLMLAGGGTMLHEYIDKRHKELGSIFYEKLGCNTKLVFISDPLLIKRVFLSLEGKYPIHILPDPWVLYEKLYGSKRGLFFMNSEEWLTNRRIMNQHLLREGSIEWLEEPIKNSVKKFVHAWRGRVENGSATVNLESDMYRLSIEVMLAILAGSSSNGVKYSEAMISNFSDTLKQIFKTTTKLYGLPLNICQSLNLKVWRNFKESVDASLHLAQSLVSEMVIKRGEGDGLIHKLVKDGVTDETVVRLVADFILAAGDTTAYTSIWSLYLISQDDCVKNEMRTRDVGYVKNVLKESMRLYPVAPFLTRVLPKDCILGEYKLDLHTPIIASIYTSGRDEQYFTKANMFLPFRWDRSDPRRKELGNHNPTATLPFALGARSCIGKKLATMQLTEFLTQIVNNFDFKCTNSEKVFPVTSQVLVPNEPIEMTISHRQI
ncbi:cytochrome P450 315a1, mitochondrial isoform X2 [Leguminivora glycinivorella]|uniref:cytochrome P450 315a1, mitochondrial isoform X2 n=1 Tax=Leguminivora glycinivorella TaxID=1035111 RepID=UPI00200E46E8|nr:cytochrome P450 315a1, mitochondrial isoform X2 [Leguminivora glycinivorella]